jgi:hypothetical protein
MVTNVFLKFFGIFRRKKFKSCYEFGKKSHQTFETIGKKTKKTGPAYNEGAPIVGRVCSYAPGIKDHLTRLKIIFLYLKKKTQY